MRITRRLGLLSLMWMLIWASWLGWAAEDVAAEGPPELPSFKLPYANVADVRWTGGPHSFDHGGDLDGTYTAGEGSGLDFAGTEDPDGKGPKGRTPHFRVLAVAAGTVEDVKTEQCDAHKGLGCWVAVRHDVGGTVGVYGHLRPGSIRVKKGDAVGQGDVLAEAGQSGGQEQVHLHLELRHGNRDCPTEQDEIRRQMEEFKRSCFFGDPFGWDDGIPFVDGYHIFGYYTDGDALKAYNYDGSAIKLGGGNEITTVDEFPYLDLDEQGKGHEHPAIARVHSRYRCESDHDCEDNGQTDLVQFAGHGASFGPGQNIVAQVLGLGDAPDSGRLVSTNVPAKDEQAPPSSPLQRFLAAIVKLAKRFADKVSGVTSRGSAGGEAAAEQVPGPTDAAREFMTAIAERDTGAAVAHLHPENRLTYRFLLDAAFRLSNALQAETDVSGLRYEETSNDGQTTVVHVTGDLATVVTIDNETYSDVSPVDFQLRLENVDGQWFVLGPEEILKLLEELRRE